VRRLYKSFGFKGLILRHDLRAIGDTDSRTLTSALYTGLKNFYLNITSFLLEIFIGAILKLHSFTYNVIVTRLKFLVAAIHICV
jgi:hypothetical protein